VTLQVPRRNTKCYVHHLVLEAFVGPRGDGEEARHLDGHRDNAALSNLSWGTAKENTADKRNHGTYHEGERHGQSKLTTADVLAIRRLSRNGVSRKRLGKLFGVHSGTISQVVLRYTWKHVA
jgi:hypothetical protein